MGRLQHIYSELRRRRIFRALLGWGVVSFAVLQVAEPVMHALDLKDWVLKVVVVVLAAGFPVAALLSWFFDLGPGGVTRTPEEGPEPAGASPSQRRGALAGLVILSVLGGAALAFVALRTLERLPEVAPSVAVLPFADMSPGKDQEYLSDGIAEEIRSALSRVEGLRVAGRTSSHFFKGKGVPIADVGRELNVGSVLEGGVRRVGDRIRVTATIVSVTDGHQASSESWDRDLRDILAVENEIAREVVAALKVRLFGGRSPAVRDPPRTTAEAHLHVLRGRQAFARGSAADIARAVEEFEKATRADPNLAVAWASLAVALDYDAEARPDLEGLLAAKQRALEAANRAVAVGPEVPEAYLVRALLRGLHRLEWREARADVDRAKALGAGADASLGSSRLLALEGRPAEALAEAERCAERDPLNANCLMRIGYYSSAVGQLERARHAYERVLEIAPDHAYASGFLGQVLVVEGRAQDALAEAARSRGREEFRILTVALAEQALGHPAASRRARDDLVARFAHSMPFQIAEALAWSGDADGAFRWLERAAERRDLGLTFLRLSPFLASLRGDPRYPAFLRRLNLPAS